ncbi:hypothetical protein [Aliiglaciecola sp. LCG003]|uniref:hypothetical protein n=1 Tax=Aliiglaciecola sp. LCG003 TaxID=3053655 RepID=UPI0025724B40|nr:hypothetical protein [Aliiglaciecola sp. LCG003]WJG07992.1 hypothetical protein QR722_11545 [Aliiglaciecola sp. LCG003]
MSNDLIFSILPREGKAAIEKDELRVKKVEKEAKLRPLNDEEKELNTEEREAREKYLRKAPNPAKEKDKQEESAKDSDKLDPELPEIDEHGRKHLDIYI